MIADSPRYYRLVGHDVEPVNDVLTWGEWFETADRRVAESIVGLLTPDAPRVSTVFLGLDHAWDDGPPLIFETMIFWPGHDLDGDQDRYSTWDEAMAGHLRLTELVKAARS